MDVVGLEVLEDGWVQGEMGEGGQPQGSLFSCKGKDHPIMKEGGVSYFGEEHYQYDNNIIINFTILSTHPSRTHVIPKFLP